MAAERDVGVAVSAAVAPVEDREQSVEAEQDAAGEKDEADQDAHGAAHCLLALGDAPEGVTDEKKPGYS